MKDECRVAAYFRVATKAQDDVGADRGDPAARPESKDDQEEVQEPCQPQGQ